MTFLQNSRVLVVALQLLLACALVAPSISARPVSDSAHERGLRPGALPSGSADEVSQSALRAMVSHAYAGELRGLYGLNGPATLENGVNESTSVIVSIVASQRSRASAAGIPQLPAFLTEDAVNQTLAGIVALFAMCERDAQRFDPQNVESRASGEVNDGLDNVYGGTSAAGDPTCLMALTDYLGSATRDGGRSVSEILSSPSDQAVLWGLVEHYTTLRHSGVNVSVVFASVPELLKELLLASLPPALAQVNEEFALCANPQRLLDDPRTWSSDPAADWCGGARSLPPASSTRGSASPVSPKTREDPSSCQQQAGDWQNPTAVPLVHPHNDRPLDSMWQIPDFYDLVNETDLIGMSWHLSKPDAGQCYLTITCDDAALASFHVRGRSFVNGESTFDTIPFPLHVGISTSGSDSGNQYGPPARLTLVKITESRPPDFPHAIQCAAAVSPPEVSVTWEPYQYVYGSYRADLSLSLPDQVVSSAGSLSPKGVELLAAQLAFKILLDHMSISKLWSKVLGKGIPALLDAVFGDAYQDYSAIRPADTNGLTSGVDFTNGYGMQDGGHYVTPKGFGFRVLATPTVSDAQQNGCNPCHGYLHVDAYSDVRFTAGVAWQEVDACSCSGLTLPWTGYLWHRSVPFQVGFSY